MAYLRAAGVLFTLIIFFAIGAPLQWVILRVWPLAAPALPLAFNRMLLYFLQIRTVVHGEIDGSGGAAALPQLLVANHVSWTDIPVLGTLHSISFLAKSEVAHWPIIATFAELQRTVFVDRASRKSIRDANAAMAKRMLEGGWVALFPEGTTYDGTALGRFHSSHFAAATNLLAGAAHVDAVRIQPVAIRYSSARAAWLGDDLLLPHIMTLVKGAPITCDIFLCRPLRFERRSGRKEVAQTCTEEIAAMLAATQGDDTARKVASEKV
jgi:1-acyl-sn-glycerol-3-phosphate acyltransferase